MRVVIEASEQYKSFLIEVAEAINAKISFDDKDAYEDIPEHVKLAVEESQVQYEDGKYTDFSDVKASLLRRLHKK